MRRTRISEGRELGRTEEQSRSQLYLRGRQQRAGTAGLQLVAATVEGIQGGEPSWNGALHRTTGGCPAE